ncbi:glycerophosphodiester phosphodiesterase [Nocardia sp. NEAU-G5]|uniref:Glycerophosphodiester phosphodiesterase n=1 Tax=Nocardia albiluteola TaxID=2842303 RepID=A0ABS6B6L7_9NOCA|nr:glycerophosphodiester phosphodiesterase family protein [Nocardia albiluteola]MBU3065371.1 glycerophosphodiester phosphodiesterase [Nocardia albiluteola]
MLLLAAFAYTNNTNALADHTADKPFILANGGMQQDFSPVGLTNQTCIASRMLPPVHRYLENTIESMAAAFRLGAGTVEFDVQPTRDKHLVVFHDYDLRCRTNGTGHTEDYTLDQLRTLDIGYGYTADGGRTFPFRDKGYGPMPSLEEVLNAFPGRRLLIDMKSDDPADGTLLAHILAGLPDARRSALTVEGGDRSIDAVRQQLPHQRVMSKSIIERCAAWYVGVGWTGHVPDSCKHIELLLPDRLARWGWGWPGVFLDRMRNNDTIVVVEKGDGSEEFSSGFDSPQDLQRLPADYSGGVWTNRIDRIAPVFAQR